MTIPTAARTPSVTDAATYSMQEAVRLTGVTPHTLRWYERIGLVPGVERRPTGQRRFTAANLRWVILLRMLRATGMPVAKLQELTARHQEGGTEPVREVIDAHRAQVLVVLSLLQHSLSVLDVIDKELHRMNEPPREPYALVRRSKRRRGALR